MPSNVGRPPRRHGRISTNQNSATIPIGPRISNVTHANFIQPGSGVGPGGTRLKYGPVIQSTHT